MSNNQPIQEPKDERNFFEKWIDGVAASFGGGLQSVTTGIPKTLAAGLTAEQVAKQQAASGVVDTGLSTQGEQVATEAIGQVEDVSAGWLLAPYRNYVARPLSTAFLAANIEYQKQIGGEQGMAFFDVETWKKGWQDARHVSPGQSIVGFVGGSLVDGTQGTDKLDWSNAEEVRSYFNHGPQRWISFGADAATMAFLDPYILAGKGIGAARRSVITVPVTTKNLPKIINDIDRATIHGETNSWSPTIDYIKRNKDSQFNLLSNQFIAQGGTEFANALQSAANRAIATGNDALIGDVLKVGIGDSFTIDKAIYEATFLADDIGIVTKKKFEIEEKLKDPTSPPMGSRQGLLNITRRNAVSKMEQRLVEANAELNVYDRISTQTLGTVQQRTVSRFGRIEKARKDSAQRFADSYWSQDIGPGARVTHYFEPGSMLHEKPSGRAEVSGLAGDRSHLEFAARIREWARINKKPGALGKKYFDLYAADMNKTSRHQMLLRFDEKAMRDTVITRMKQELGRTASPTEAKLIIELADSIAKNSSRHKQALLERVIERDYTIVDETGSTVYQKQLKDYEKRAAQEIAHSRAGAGTKPNANDIAEAKKIVKESLSGVIPKSSQLPNVHYGVNLDRFNDVLSEHASQFKAIIDDLQNNPRLQNLSAKELYDEFALGKSSELLASERMVKNPKEKLRTGGDLVLSGFDSFYNSIWKPVTLASLHYTSRNVFEGWQRMVAVALETSRDTGMPVSQILRDSLEPNGGLITKLNEVITRKGYNKFVKNVARTSQNVLKTQGKKLSDEEYKVNVELQDSLYKSADSVHSSLLESLDVAERIVQNYSRPNIVATQLQKDVVNNMQTMLYRLGDESTLPVAKSPEIYKYSQKFGKDAEENSTDIINSLYREAHDLAKKENRGTFVAPESNYPIDNLRLIKELGGKSDLSKVIESRWSQVYERMAADGIIDTIKYPNVESFLEFIKGSGHKTTGDLSVITTTADIVNANKTYLKLFHGSTDAEIAYYRTASKSNPSIEALGDYSLDKEMGFGYRPYGVGANEPTNQLIARVTVNDLKFPIVPISSQNTYLDEFAQNFGKEISKSKIESKGKNWALGEDPALASSGGYKSGTRNFDTSKLYELQDVESFPAQVGQEARDAAGITERDRERFLSIVNSKNIADLVENADGTFSIKWKPNALKKLRPQEIQMLQKNNISRGVTFIKNKFDLKDSIVAERKIGGKNPPPPEVNKELFNAIVDMDHTRMFEILSSVDERYILDTLGEVQQRVTKQRSFIEQTVADKDFANLPYGMREGLLIVNARMNNLEVSLATTALASITKASVRGKLEDLISAKDVLNNIKKSAEGEFNFIDTLKGPDSFADIMGAIMRQEVDAVKNSSAAIFNLNNVTLENLIKGKMKGTTINPFIVDEKTGVRTSNVNWAEIAADFGNRHTRFDESVQKLIRIDVTDKAKFNEVVAWAKSKEATEWRKTMRISLGRLVDEGFKDPVGELIKRNAIYVDGHLPEIGLDGRIISPLKDADGKFVLDANGDYIPSLRMKASNGELTARDMLDIPEADRVTTYGHVAVESEVGNITSQVANGWKTATQWMFKHIGSNPETYLVRHPFYTMMYRTEMRRLANLMKSQGRSLEYIDGRVSEISLAAHKYAYKNTMDKLYSVERKTDPGEFMRFFSPFYMAKQNSNRFWFGYYQRNPQALARYFQLYSSPTRIFDTEDNSAKDVNYVNPFASAGASMMITIPDSVAKYLNIPTDSRFKVQISSFDLINNGTRPFVPELGGPVSTYAIGGLLNASSGQPYDPELLLTKLGIKPSLITETILPFYQTNKSMSSRDTFINAILDTNSWMDSALAATSTKPLVSFVPSALSGDAARDRFNSRLVKNFVILNQDWMGEQDKFVTMTPDEQSKHIADMLSQAASYATSEFILEGFLSLGPTVGNFKVEDKSVRIGKELRQYQKQYGQEEGRFRYLQFLSGKSNFDTAANDVFAGSFKPREVNMFGVLSTPQTLYNVVQNKALWDRVSSFASGKDNISDSKMLGTLFNGGDAVIDYTQVANQKLFALGVKKNIVDPKDIANEFVIESGNSLYRNYQNFYKAEAEAKGIPYGSEAFKALYKEKLEKAKTEIENINPGWFFDKQYSPNKSLKQINIINSLISDPKFVKTVSKSNPIIPALVEYMEKRKTLVKQRTLYSTSTDVNIYDSGNYAGVVYAKEQMAKQLIQKYPEFKDFYDYYLSYDPLLAPRGIKE